MTDPNVKRALIVVDMQEDFCPPNGSLPVPNGRSIIPLINTLLTLPSSTFPLKIATKDWHPANHVSFAANHPPPDNVPFVSTTTITNPSNPAESYNTRLWPVHCVRGTPGAALVPELLAAAAHLTHVIEKGTDSRLEMYSAFYDPLREPRVSDSGLAGVLKGEGVQEVWVVGLAGDYCVRATARDAVREGMRTFVIEEGTRPVDVAGWEGTKREMEREDGVRVVERRSEVVKALLGEEV